MPSSTPNWSALASHNERVADSLTDMGPSAPVQAVHEQTRSTRKAGGVTHQAGNVESDPASVNLPIKS